MKDFICLMAASLLGLNISSTAHAQSNESPNWRALADGSQVSISDEGRGNYRHYRCKQQDNGIYGCLMMESFSSFGTVYYFGLNSLPNEPFRPKSGFRCSIEPGSSFTQQIFLYPSTGDGTVLENFQGYPSSIYKNPPVWNKSNIVNLAKNNGIEIQANYFDCKGFYNSATISGGINHLFTNSFDF